MRTFNDGNCRLFQDNAPSHCNDTIYQALRNNNVNWASVRIYKIKCSVLTQVKSKNSFFAIFFYIQLKRS